MQAFGSSLLQVAAIQGHDSNQVTHKSKSKKWNIRKFRILSAFFALTVRGFNDATAGALIPYIQDHYQITYSIVSLLFVGQCVGYIGASLANIRLGALGIGRVLAIAATVQICAYVLIVPRFQFPVMVIGYCLTGFGFGLQEAQMNAYIASLPNSSSMLSWLHGFFGLGSLVSPLIATTMVKNGIRYNFYYLFLMGMCVLNLCCILGAFKFRRDLYDERNESNKSCSCDKINNDNSTVAYSIIENQEHIKQDVEIHNTAECAIQEATNTTVPSTFTNNNNNQEKYESTSVKLRKILGQRVTVVSFTFLVLYVGAETSIGGWIVSYLIIYRHGGASVGYVSSGFWGGITMGRVLLPRLNSLVGERRVIWLYTALCIGLELVAWFTPVLTVDAVAVSIVGFFMGPIYPLVIFLMTKIISISDHTTAIGFAVAVGQTGSAIFPFVVGAMAQPLGVSVLHPIVLVLLAMMGALWILMPYKGR